jgi:DNA-binding phage protein
LFYKFAKAKGMTQIAKDSGLEPKPQKGSVMEVLKVMNIDVKAVN